MKKLRLNPLSLYGMIQATQFSILEPVKVEEENWSGDFQSKRYAKRREGVDPIVFPQPEA